MRILQLPLPWCLPWRLSIFHGWNPMFMSSPKRQFCIHLCHLIKKARNLYTLKKHVYSILTVYTLCLCVFVYQCKRDNTLIEKNLLQPKPPKEKWPWPGHPPRPWDLESLPPRRPPVWRTRLRSSAARGGSPGVPTCSRAPTTPGMSHACFWRTQGLVIRRYYVHIYICVCVYIYPQNL